MVVNRSPGAWVTWALLLLVLVGGWLAWPQAQPPQAPAGRDGAPALPRDPSARPLPPAAQSQPPPVAEPATRLPGFLPAEAHRTIALVQRGGPFPHRQDGGVFGNREGRLPRKPRGWYREYTVDTPGLRHRGARRIVTGGDPPREWYYTDDHYDSFRSIAVTGNLQ